MKIFVILIQISSRIYFVLLSFETLQLNPNHFVRGLRKLMNTDSGDVIPYELEEMEIRSGEYNWVVSDDANTNLAESSCAYDRIVTTKNMDEYLYETFHLFCIQRSKIAINLWHLDKLFGKTSNAINVSSTEWYTLCFSNPLAVFSANTSAHDTHLRSVSDRS